MFNLKKNRQEAPGPDLGVFQDFLDAIGAAVVIISEDHRIIHMNSAARHSWSSAAPTDLCHRVLKRSREVCADCPFEKVISSRKWVRRESRMRTDSGWRTHENLFLYLSDPGRSGGAVALVSTDVHDARLREQEAIKEKEISRTLLESVNSVVLGFDADGNLEFVNRAAEKATGYAEEDIRDRGGIELLVPQASIGHARKYFSLPADVPRPKEPVLIALSTADGGERMVSWTWSSLVLPSGEAAGGIALGQDVTERFEHRKRAEKRAAELEIVNSVLARVGSSNDLAEMIVVSLDHLLALPAYRCGAAYLLEAGATEGRRVAATGFTRRVPVEQLSGTERTFPGTAIYNKKIEVAQPGAPVHPEVAAVMETEGLDGMVAIPLAPGGHPIGLVLLGYEGEPTEEDLGMEVLRAAAEALELGAENAYLRVEAERRAREATALFHVGQYLTGSRNILSGLSQVSREVTELLEVDACAIFLFNEGDNTIRVAAGYPEEVIRGQPVPEGSMLVHKAAAEVARTLKPLAIFDIENDDRVPDYVAETYGIRSSLHVPLIAEGKFIGNIYLASIGKHREFTDREIELTESFASQASIAIHNASLVRDLKESEQRYRSIMENSGVALVVHDGRNILYANDKVEEITGFPRDEFVSVDMLFDIVVPTDREKMRSYLAGRLSGEADVPGDYDTRILRKDGVEVVAQLLHSRMKMGGRDVFLVSANDVTARVKAEEAVKSSEERYRTLVESSGDSILIADPGGKVLFANSASSVLTGRTVSEMLGRSVYEVVHPDDKGTTLRKFKREWEAGRSVARLPVRSLVGGEEKFFEVTTAVLGEAGPETNVMLIVSDVTDRVRAQKQIEESEQKYRTIVEATHDTIISVNRAGEIIYANQAVEPMFGVTPEQAVGNNVLRSVLAEDRQRAENELSRDFRTGRSLPNVEIRCRRADGKVISVEVNSGLVGWPDDNAVEILVIRDTTERGERERERGEQLRAEEYLSRITAMFVDPGDLYMVIEKMLRELSSYLGGDRAYYVELASDGKTIAKALEVTPDGDNSFSERLLKADASSFEAMFETLSSGTPFAMEDANALESTPEKEFAQAFNVESVLLVPVFVRNDLKCALGYTSTREKRRWSDQEVGLLQEVARTISRAIERRDFVEELGRSERFRASITESIGEGLFVLTNGAISWVNSQVSDLYGYPADELIGRTSEMLLPDPRELEKIALSTLEALHVNGMYTREETIKRKDGTLFDVQFSVTSLGLDETGAGQVLVAVKDVTESKRMREEVEAAAEAYSNLFSSAGDALLVHGRDGSIIDANERAEAYTLYAREALIKMNMRDLVPERLRGRYEEVAQRVESESAATFETIVLKADGTLMPVEATSRLTRIWGENAALSALRDVSERKKAEAETARRAVQLASLNEIVKASTSSLDLDTVLAEILRVTIEVSAADAGMVLLGNPDGRGRVVVTSPPGRFHPSSAPMPVPEMLRWLEGERRGAVILNLEMEQEDTFSFTDVLKKGGIEQALMIPLYSGEKSLGVITLGTKQKGVFDERDRGFYNAAGAEIAVSIENALIYKELAAEHERLSLLYRSAQSISGELELDAILETTAAEAAKAVGSEVSLLSLIEDDQFKWCAAYGLDIAEMKNVRLAADSGIGGEVARRKRAVLMPPRENASEHELDLLANDAVVQATDVDWAVVIPMIAGDRVVGAMGLTRPGSGRELSSEDVLLLEAIGRQAGVAIQNARLYDETRNHLEALEKAHRELQVLDNMKSDFVSTVSHELRSPLAVIEGFAQTMSEHFDRIDRETHRESIEIILKKSIALEGLIENILDMSRIEDGRLEVQREPFDILELCYKMREDQERIHEIHQVVIHTEVEPLIVMADKEKTEVALGNLVRNAIKFSPDGGAVTISVKQVGVTAEVSVADTGIGIEPDQFEKIFDRFYQVDSSETRSFPGSGLGLYITREIVQSMGGTVRVESEPGKGTTFTFTLPVSR